MQNAVVGEWWEDGTDMTPKTIRIHCVDCDLYSHYMTTQAALEWAQDHQDIEHYVCKINWERVH